jgi:hypothetical protein
MNERQALLRIRDEIISLHDSPDAVLADFFDRVNVDEEGQLIVDGVRLELDGAKRRVAKRFGR